MRGRLPKSRRGRCRDRGLDAKFHPENVFTFLPEILALRRDLLARAAYSFAVSSHHTKEPETEVLVSRVLAGEVESFAALVRRHEKEVWRVGAAMLGDRSATANLVQQTFVNAYEHLEQYRPGHDFSRWLKGIARNLVREDLRRSEREGRTMIAYRDYLLDLYSDEGRAEQHARDLQRAVAACREQLAPAASKALALHYDEGLTVEEVASAIARTVAATRQLLFRARLALRVCVEKRLAAP
jgi:RNA polymerase sigma-70 factor (ECF subfamily)